MTGGVECVRATESLVDAARKMRDFDVGALPICAEDDRLLGMISERDIVTQCVANGVDPFSVHVEEYAQGEAVTIGADDSIEQTLHTMARHGVRRLPVVDGDELVGVVSQADVALHLSGDQMGQLVEAISKAPGR
jgi:CBS domain-containing protein